MGGRDAVSRTTFRRDVGSVNGHIDVAGDSALTPHIDAMAAAGSFRRYVGARHVHVDLARACTMTGKNAVAEPPGSQAQNGYREPRNSMRKLSSGFSTWAAGLRCGCARKTP